MITQVRKINFSRSELERSDQPKFYGFKLYKQKESIKSIIYKYLIRNFFINLN